MKVSEVMIDNPPVVTRDDSISRAARAIEELHSSLVPVVDSHETRRVVGVITDKDVMRCTSSGENPQTCPVSSFMGNTYETVHVEANVETALAEVPHNGSSPGGDTGSGATGTDTGGLMGRRPIVVVDDERRVVGLITRPHLAMDIARLQSGQVVSGRTENMQLVWRCTDCGYLLTRAEQLPDQCPDCGAPKEHFVLVTED
ncbi:MAG TPA: CBS domain-containing protein [Chloroflexia bacterium]|nr:CBS domain-containing protein [Chloroflexia bacterium]